MKRTIKIYLTAVILLTLLVGCNDKPFSGIVVDKEYIPVHKERRHRRVGKIHSSRRQCPLNGSYM
ncbi:hypothetical protein [Dysgonomonas macrotermitis]|nr:hypothetical protein [Dysgonomonas macrotermitis]